MTGLIAWAIALAAAALAGHNIRTLRRTQATQAERNARPAVDPATAIHDITNHARKEGQK